MYIDELKDGIIDGRGTFSYSNGNKYVGQWIAGKKDGQGTYTFFDGRKQSGQYKADEYWNIIMYDSVGNITRKWVNGKEIFDEKQNESIILRLWRGRMGWFDND